MKHTLALLLAVCILLCLCGCGSGTSAATDTLPKIYDGEQYQIYQNVFFNGYADSFLGQQMSATGVFVSIRDSFNGVTRYYCWGYYDQTKCCDWQWELKPDDAVLPANGSKVTFTGTFTRDPAALDGIWLTDVSLKTETVYTGETCDVDLCLMNATLERVQLLNMQYFPDEYEGKQVRLYGRILDPQTLQHPYYDNAWTQSFSAEGETPPMGTLTIIKGSFTGSIVTDATAAATTDY